MRLRKDAPKQVVTVSDLLDLIPSSLYDRLSAEFKPDKWVHKLHAQVMFKLIIYSILHSERLSLRVMETLYKDPAFQVLADAVGSTAHNSIRDRLRTVNVDYFAALYEQVYAQAAAQYSPEVLETTYQVRRVDSTMVGTFSHLLAGIRAGNSTGHKVQAKYTVEYGSTGLIQASLHTEQAYLSEERALGQAVQNVLLGPRDVLVFDRGLQKRATFSALTEAGKPFVTRLNATARYDVVAQMPPPTDSITPSGLHIEFEAQVYLYTNAQKKPHPTPFRLIQTRGQNGQPLIFVTNLSAQEASAQIVTELYRQRWDIEVLFRFLKQEMNLKHFVCHDPNACAVMLYCLMITATLVLLYKKHNEIPSYKHAKILFVKELTNSIIYDMLQSPEGIERMKRLFKPPKRE